MKLSLLFILILFITLAARAAEDGGMDGGGGNGHKPSYLTLEDVQRVAIAAPAVLQLFFNDLDYWSLGGKHWEGSFDDWRLLYRGNQNLRDVTNGHGIEVMEKAPCYEREGQEVDASIFSSKPNHICLSAFRLSQKLFKGGEEVKILSLLLHEYSHLLGTSEAEARRLQQDFEYDYETRYSFSLGETKAWLDRGYYTSRRMIQELSRLKMSLRGDLETSREILRGVQLGFDDLHAGVRFGFSVSNTQERQALKAAEYQLNVIAGYLQCQKNFGCEDLSRIFKGKKSLTTDEFVKNWLGVDEQVPGNLNLIENPSNREDVVRLVNAAIPTFELVQRNFDAARLSFP